MKGHDGAAGSADASRAEEAHRTGLEQARQLRAEVAAFAEAGVEPLTDTLAQWLTTQYISAARNAGEEAGGAGIPLTILRGLTADVVALRKGDHSAARLLIEREWVEIERGKSEERMRKQFEEWLKEPGTNERLCGKELSPEERERRMREIFGLPEKGRGGISPETREEIERAMRIL